MSIKPPIKLPKVEAPERYTGLYVFDFGDQAAVGYTADEIAVLLESGRHRDGKVYRIHRALPDGTMELEGVPRARFEAEDGVFFYRADAAKARQDFQELSRLAEASSPPCRMKTHLARLEGEPVVHVTAMMFPAEYTHDVSAWLKEIGYRGGDYCEGGISQVTAYQACSATILERGQLHATGAQSRPAEEVLASTHLPVQRRFAS